jgi:hypothetical protein
MQTKQTQTQTKTQFTAAEIIKAKYIKQNTNSRTHQFKTNPRAYKINPDGSISSAWELAFFS